MAAVFTVMFAGPAAACVTVTVMPPVVTAATCNAPAVVTPSKGDLYSWKITELQGQVVYTPTLNDLGNRFPEKYQWTYNLADLAQLGRNNPACRTAVTPVKPPATAPTCLAEAVVNPPFSDKYSWSFEGPTNATVYTAIAKDGYTLSGLDHWTFDLSKLAWNSTACQPHFEVASECGAVTITFVNASLWDRFPDYRIDGQVPSGDYGSGPVYSITKVKAGQTAVIYSGSFAEDYSEGSVTVAYQDILGAERDIDTPSTTVAVPTNCMADVLPVSVITQAQVTPIPPTCDADGSLTLTNGENYTWNDTRPLAVGRHEAIATAAAGYVFSDQETTATFTVEVLPATGDQSTDANAGCYVAAVPPVVDPPVVDPPVVAPVIVVPVVTPVAVVASKTVASKTVASQTPAVNNRVLAYTGIDGLPWLLLGAAGLIGFGALTVSRSSRERRVRA